MKIYKDGKQVGTFDDKLQLTTANDELRRVVDLLKSEGMQTLGPTATGIGDAMRYIPVSKDSLGLFSKTLEAFGYDTN